MELIRGFSPANSGHLALWSEAAKRLDKAVKGLKGTHEMIDVMDEISKGAVHLWHGNHASAVVEVVKHPRLTLCNIFLAGCYDRHGLPELKKWGAVGGPLDRWAASEMNCDRIQYDGRRGWARVLDGVEVTGEIGMRQCHG